jgi:hypothetical protein
LVHFTSKGETVKSDFRKFGNMKEDLRGRRFSSDEVTSAVQNWLKTQPKNFFLTELKKNL